ncbi:hypothetical protein [Abyssisolibacter fermentans]|uniref:hypothetical protein n=1 Tax=Abyssisolibacter fermentans TaxID=1766203 RepID=UPI000831CA9E|nr:hypothetical protein [Abyssisolibacter fermentans]
MYKKSLILLLVAITLVFFVGEKFINIESEMNKDVKIKDTQVFNFNKIDSNNVYIKKSKSEYMYNKYYSPDNKNFFIRQIGDFANYSSVDNALYLNRVTNNVFSKIDSIRKKPVMWLNNYEVLVNGMYIYNIETKKIEDYIMKDILDNSYVINYSLDNEKEKIAICLTNKVNNTKDIVYSIYVSNIKDKSYKKAYEDSKINTNFICNIIWDQNNNIIFDKDGLKVMKYNQKLNKLSDYINEDIDKLNRQQIDEVDDDDDGPPTTYNLLSVSKDNRYISVGDSGELIRIIDIKNNTEVISNDENRIPYSPSFCWVDTNIFAYIDNFVHIDNYIYICSINDGVYTIEETIDCQKLKGDNLFISNLRLEKNELLFDVIEFSKPGSFDTVKKVTTYEIVQGNSTGDR